MVRLKLTQSRYYDLRRKAMHYFLNKGQTVKTLDGTLVRKLGELIIHGKKIIECEIVGKLAIVQYNEDLKHDIHSDHPLNVKC